jgi:hypothetical protein
LFPLVALTVHVTAVFVVPVTVAVYWAVVLRRTVAGPVTVTTTCGVGEVEEGFTPLEQPARISAAAVPNTAAGKDRFMIIATRRGNRFGIAGASTRWARASCEGSRVS